jgi:hypothetical protein
MIQRSPASELSNPRLAKHRPQPRTRLPRAPQTFEQLALAFLTDLEMNRRPFRWAPVAAPESED